MNPRYYCQTCGQVEIITGITVASRDRAKRRLVSGCKARGHEADVAYLAGIA